MSANATNSTQDFTYFSNSAKWCELGVIFAGAFTGILLELLVSIALWRSSKRNSHLRATNIYLIDKTVGDILFMLSWAVAISFSDNKIFAYMVGFDSTTEEQWYDARNLSLILLDFLNNWTFIHSMYILTVLSAVRCVAVTKASHGQLGRHTSKRNVLKIMIVLWIVTFLVAVLFEWWDAYLIPTVPDIGWELRLIQSLVFYVIPLTVIGVAYISTIISLRRSTTVWRKFSGINRVVSKRLKLCRQLCYLIVIFAVCWLPYNVFFVIMFKLWPTLENVPLAIMWCRRGVEVIAYMNYICNPICLILMSTAIRKEVKKMLGLVQHGQDKFRHNSSMVTFNSFSEDVPAESKSDANHPVVYSEIC